VRTTCRSCVVVAVVVVPTRLSFSTSLTASTSCSASAMVQDGLIASSAGPPSSSSASPAPLISLSSSHADPSLARSQVSAPLKRPRTRTQNLYALCPHPLQPLVRASRSLPARRTRSRRAPRAAGALIRRAARRTRAVGPSEAQQGATGRMSLENKVRRLPRSPCLARSRSTHGCAFSLRPHRLDTESSSSSCSSCNRTVP